MTKYIIVVLLVLCGLFGVLSYHFYGAKAEAESALQPALDKLSEIEKSKETGIFSCEITDSILAEWQKGLQENQAKSQATIVAIDRLPSKSQKVVKDEVSDVVDIDGKLPKELVEILSKSFCSNREIQDATICPDQTSP